MDTLVIKGMKFTGYHGVYEHEKRDGNEFEVDVIIRQDFSAPAASDDLTEAIDYSSIHSLVADVMKGPSADLIEHLAFTIGETISSRFTFLNEFEVRLRKLHPPLKSETEYTEVRLSWPRL